MRMRVRLLASLSGLRIRCCCELWCKSETQLGSRVAVAVALASDYSSESTPSLGTSICCGYSPKKQKKKKKKKKVFFKLLCRSLVLCLACRKHLINVSSHQASWVRGLLCHVHRNLATRLHSPLPRDPHLGDADASESLHALWQAAQDVQHFPGHFGRPHGPASTGHQCNLLGRGQGTTDLLCHLVGEMPTRRLCSDHTHPKTPYPGF